MRENIGNCQCFPVSPHRMPDIALREAGWYKRGMMDAAMQMGLYVLAAVLYVAGLVGCFVPVLPGPPVAYAGFLCWLGAVHAFGWRVAAVAGAVVVLATILDTVVPAWGARKFHSTRWGAWGAVVGAVAGAFFFPAGLLLGPFAGAVAGELLAGRPFGDAAMGGVGALLGFLFGIAVKLASCLFMAVLAWAAIGD